MEQLTFKQFLAEEQEVVKNILSYKDGSGNLKKLHVGTNARGNFFVVLKGAHADFHLSTPMFRFKGGSDEAAKTLKDAIRKTWDAVKDKSAKHRALALKTTLNDVSDVNWKIES